MPSGLTSTSAGSMGASSASAVSFEKAVEESPWKERDQSTWAAWPSGTVAGPSWKPEERSSRGGAEGEVAD